jgi:hypothetical protein
VSSANRVGCVRGVNYANYVEKFLADATRPEFEGSVWRATIQVRHLLHWRAAAEG